MPSYFSLNTTDCFVDSGILQLLYKYKRGHDFSSRLGRSVRNTGEHESQSILCNVVLLD